ncbi:UDP-N-acetylglucosamine 2-epimerase (non-hydrolyzing) [Muribacter muris]|uniref:UDP-N-acetylglucosamine 2-epimerase n=1 Tax=Muribacter muris TaxID=67855 RepID=A0A4Y9JWW8_9PAST|nr:UDP-N-acetylglucosamine 2-epimerase (non-hydrolyzing) [Muribacter muris]MBF0785073.1 UDP-N-acetylglucosamine 2-epimerase (non-hydrolyzing) [Muribacter muris]MBF0826712.1 UDP-N-acetylglucosamine 2-epimerase (non-hydrolyzing) [Muribacter muris]TFV10313.1 UDP-N-acetylglucosamine 2-epimerase (non-hydrolyzing) [Muribacter muris]
MRHILIVFGTRPEAIKLAPLIKTLQRQAEFKLTLCATGQHRQMLDQVLHQFEIQPDIDLNIMSAQQSLAELHARLLPALQQVLAQHQPDLVLVHGDTSSAFITALAAYYQHIPLAHIEAGLRTGDLHSPYPEEANRRLISVLAAYHFAPTPQARRNLLKEGVAAERIWVTGNTVIDALKLMLQNIAENAPLAARLAADFAFLEPQKQCVLVTCHRRENWGEPLAQICQALARLARCRPNVQIVFPVHLNPQLREPIARQLAGIENIFLLEPQAYLPFVYLMSRADLILTDSGGIQEEANGLAKPILLMRETTERTEAAEAGTMTLVGTDADRLVSEVLRHLAMPSQPRSAPCFYGDGQASERIAAILKENQNGGF